MKFSYPVNDFKKLKVDYSEVVSVVDASSFRPDSEAVRALKVNPAGASAGNPVYDYSDGKVPEDDPISAAIVALRSGKLDKADIPQVKQHIINEAKDKAEVDKANKLLDATAAALGIGATEDSNTSSK